MVTLAPAELTARARRIRLVLSDCDGVLTDGGVFVSAEGEVMKRFNLRDGMGVERLRDAGVTTAFVTRERSEILSRRAEKLRLEHCWIGVQDKLSHLDTIIQESGVGSPAELAYIGDDVNDLGIMRAIAEVGLTGTPADGFEEVGRVAHFRGFKAGGQGAFREFAEWLLRLRGGASAMEDEQR